MKIRLHTILIAVLILLALNGFSSHALSSGSKPVSDLCAKPSPSSELPGDMVIQFPEPNLLIYQVSNTSPRWRIWNARRICRLNWILAKILS